MPHDQLISDQALSKHEGQPSISSCSLWERNKSSAVVGRRAHHNYLGQRTVNFDNKLALTNMMANIRFTFAYSTAFNSSGKLEYCSNAQLPGVCWTYRYRCFNDYVNVEDVSGYGHFHLGFTAAGFNPLCGFGDPGDGYGAGFNNTVGSSCVIPNWKTEPRTLNPHLGTQWVSIKMNPSGSMTTKKVFDLSRIYIGGTVPIQLWFHSTIDGGWYGWPSMAPNNRSTIASSHDIDEVQISGASGSAIYQIEDFDLLD